MWGDTTVQCVLERSLSGTGVRDELRESGSGEVSQEPLHLQDKG